MSQVTPLVNLPMARRVGRQRRPARTRRIGRTTSRGPPNADKPLVSKSVYIVGGIGIVGCIALSLMMQHLLKVQGDRARPALAIEIEQDLADCLHGNVDVSTLDVDGERTLCVRLPVKKGLAADRLARAASDLLWKRAPSWRETPERLRLEVVAEGGAPFLFDSRPPGLRILRTQKLSPVVPPK